MEGMRLPPVRRTSASEDDKKVYAMQDEDYVFQVGRYGFASSGTVGRCGLITQTNSNLRVFADTIRSATCPCKSGGGEGACAFLFCLLEQLVSFDNVGEPAKDMALANDVVAEQLCLFLDRIIANKGIQPAQEYLAHLLSGIISRGYPAVAVAQQKFSLAPTGVNCYDHACEAVFLRENLSTNPCVPPFRFRGRLYHKEQQLSSLYSDKRERWVKSCRDFEIVFRLKKNDSHANGFRNQCPLVDNKEGVDCCSREKNRQCPR